MKKQAENEMKGMKWDEFGRKGSISAEIEKKVRKKEVSA